MPISKALTDGLRERSLPQTRRDIAMQIAINLRLTHHALELHPFLGIDPEVDELCKTLISNFADIDKLAKESFLHGPLYSIRTLLGTVVYTADDLKKSSVMAFFKARDTEDLINTINEKCSRLYRLLNDSNNDGGSSVPDNFSSGSNENLAGFSQNLFNALELHVKCNPQAPNKLNDHQSQAWHPTRICLMEEEHDPPSISLLVAPMGMQHWQDCHLIIKSENKESENKEPENNTVINENTNTRPFFCNQIDSPELARIDIDFNASCSIGQFQFHENNFLEFEPGSGHGKCLADVLRDCQLMSKEKAILAYMIAQAYYRFYDSDLMRTKWTSNSILFMHPTKGTDEILLRPYLISPFGIRDDREEDFVDNPKLVHKHPRFLAFGILLLEIGLSEPFQSIPQRDSISQANSDHKIADTLLKALKSAEWDGFSYKSYFDGAVEYCIREARRRVDSRHELGHVGKATNPPAKPSVDKQQGIRASRKDFYKNVVLRLKYIAETGFGHTIENELSIRMKPKTDSLGTELPNQLPELVASFHSGRTVRPEKWLEDLYSIGTLVEDYRRHHKVKPSIRVAILDTGIDKNNTSRCIKVTRDFVDGLAIGVTDTFGHGTFMARLVMICAPSAEVIIARVAKSTKELEASRENIRDAIIWAGIECEADIISMSFGFPKDHEGIDNAIRTVQSQRKESVLFFASAGNSSFEDETFPARHPSVISINAANCRGTFLETNPRLPAGAPAIWGTYGSDIPDRTFTAVQEKYPNICQPGSSIATAVAAGISATMIAYADVLPHLEPSVNENNGGSLLDLLRRKRGMEALFRAMVKKNDGSRQWFIDPISFWRDTSDKDTAKHFTRYSKIHSYLQHVSSQQADSS